MPKNSQLHDISKGHENFKLKISLQHPKDLFLPTTLSGQSPCNNDDKISEFCVGAVQPSAEMRHPGDLNIAGQRHLQLQLRLRDALLRPDDRLRQGEHLPGHCTVGGEPNKPSIAQYCQTLSSIGCMSDCLIGRNTAICSSVA